MSILVSETNPNADRGGTGCLYSGEQKDYDCAGRHVVFPKVKVFSALNPIASICEYHLRAAVAKLDDPATESARTTYGREKPAVPGLTEAIEASLLEPDEELSL